MEILRRDWMKYIENLSKADDKAAELITDYLSEHSILSDEGFQKFVDYYYAVVTKYAEGASEMAAQAYEILAEVQGATIKSAEPAETPTYGECMKTIRGTMLDSDQAKSLAQSAGRLVRRTGVDTTINNALRDGAEWAWVPNGDTCAFCMMLASNGWQRASKKAIKNGHASHIHANCDCTYAIRFDGKSTVEGYDPDYYKSLYNNADGKTWRDKLNSMRRDKYAQNKDIINAQKRRAYKARRNGVLSYIDYEEKNGNGSIDRIKAIDNNSKNFDQVEYTKKFLEALNVDTSQIDIVAEPNNNAYGASMLSRDATPDVVRYEKITLDSEDWRSIEYKKKTAIHEVFHVMANNQEWDGLEYKYDRWIKNKRVSDVEEAMTESAAHYLLKESGVDKNLHPSYAKEIVYHLPRLKRESGGQFKECVTIRDFGKIAYEKRAAKEGRKWLPLADSLDNIIIDDSYYDPYHKFISKHIGEAVSRISETIIVDDRDEYAKLIKDALESKDIDNPLTAEQENAYYQAIAFAMTEIGVK